MDIIDLNPNGGIGANCMALRIGDFTFVIDAGLHPKESGHAALPALHKIAHMKVDLIFLTHTHLDHLGALPLLVAQHPDTPVITSRDSFALFKRLLHNSCNVMHRRSEEGLGPAQLYSHGDVARCARSVLPAAVGVPRVFESNAGDRITFTLFASGHIPGAVGILFEYRHRKIFVTGDVLFTDTAMLDGARFPTGVVDTLIIETTRGLTERPSAQCRDSEIQRLLACLRSTLNAGGAVLIPAFALGRIQELLVTLIRARREGLLPECPVFLSGLGIDLLNQFDQISRVNPALRIRRSILRELGAQKLPSPHSFERAGPAIYLLSSGMLTEHTPSWNAAARLLGNPLNALCFVGYCDPDSPGGQLLATPHGQPFSFPTLHRAIPVAAQVERFDLSSHADRDELLDFAVARSPRSVILTHGDPLAREWFANALNASVPSTRVFNPNPLQWANVP